MSLGELVTAISIHLLTPVVGFGFYLSLCRKMKKEGVPSAPVVDYFILFFTLGGWLLVALTLLLWKPSGMFLIGVFYLVFVSPITTVGLVVSSRTTRDLSFYHRRAYQISVGYSAISIFAVFAWFARLAYQR